ncbi:MAG: GGDEF domain-containing protein [Rheinheimera sp.]
MPKTMGVSISETAEFDKFAKPLLQLLKELTGLETTFLTLVDEQQQQQWVVTTESSAALTIPAGLQVAWQDSMCRLMFHQQCNYVTDIPHRFTNSTGARAGMQTFMVLPVSYEGALIGTLCGADRSTIKLSDTQLGYAKLIAVALSSQLKLLADNQHAHLQLQQQQQETDSLRQQVDNLEELASTDPLTGLPNRRAFEERFGQMVDIARRNQEEIGLMLIDIDHFKQVNDQYGHDVGDRVIQQVGRGLLQLARAADIPCRIGGDEFQLAAIGSNAAGLSKLALRLQKYLLQQCSKLGVSCTLSIGIATTLQSSVEDLFKSADIALYRSKQGGRNMLSVYRPELENNSLPH